MSPRPGHEPRAGSVMGRPAVRASLASASQPTCQFSTRFSFPYRCRQSNILVTVAAGRSSSVTWGQRAAHRLHGQLFQGTSPTCRYERLAPFLEVLSDQEIGAKRCLSHGARPLCLGDGDGGKEMRDARCGPSLRDQSQGRWLRSGLEHSQGTGTLTHWKRQWITASAQTG